MSRVLVVGATGALCPAALRLAAQGDDVVAVARPGPRLDELVAQDPDHLHPLALDYHRDDLVRALAPVAPVDDALLYCPTAGHDAVRRLTALARGRVVVLLTSASADPDLANPPRDPSGGRAVWVTLGWKGAGDQSRWHTSEEISLAALQALDEGQGRTLGVVRPWPDRPSARE